MLTNAIGQLCTLDHGGTCLLTCPKANLTPRDYERIKAACHEFLEDVRAASRGSNAKVAPALPSAVSPANGQAPALEPLPLAALPKPKHRPAVHPRGRIAEYRRALREYLLEKGAPQVPSSLMPACSIPKGSFYYAIKHPWFVNAGGGFDLTDAGRAGAGVEGVAEGAA